MKLLAYLKIIRPINVLITFLVVLVAILISQTGVMEISIYLLVPLSASLIAAAGNVINDIYDIETDRISHPERVLVLGNLDIKRAWLLNFLLNTTAVFITLFISKTLLVIAVLTIVLLYFYSTHLQKLPLIGNITVAILTGAAFLYGGVAVDNISSAIIPAVFAIMINLIRELVKDTQDMEGDLKNGYQTFPIKFGVLNTHKLIIALSIILILMTLYPFFFHIYRIEYFIIVMLFVNPLIVYLIKIISSNKEALPKVSILLKINMIAGLIAIYLGK
jgi:geranylgeranylglycerol-phosphate geranylgeranyltransferase